MVYFRCHFLLCLGFLLTVCKGQFQFGVQLDQYDRILLDDPAGKVFGTVCILQFEDEDASTVCRQLGLGQHGAAIPVQNKSSYSHALFNVFCTGIESSLQQCAYETVDYNGACRGAEDAGVHCFGGGTNNSSSQPSPSQSQFGVEVDQYGRVLLADQTGQIFGTVCMLQFEDEDASTVCRQLGLGQHGAAIPVPRSSSYTHAIFNVFCMGVESSLQQCAHETVDYSGACHGAEDAGVHCFGSTTNSSSPANTGHVQFGVEVDQYGRVLLADQAGQIFGSVCMIEFEDEDASTVCRQLGLGQHGTAIPVPRSSTYTHKLFNVLCTGVESSLQQCVYETVDYNGVCRGAEDAGVHCFGGTTNSTSQSNTSHTQFGVKVDQYGRVLLADQAGQIFGSVCMLQFEDEDASTVCRQLGLGQHGAAIPVPRSSSYIHAMFNVFCTGVESNLQQCAHETVDYTGACHSAEDAGVHCFGSTTNSSNPANTGHVQFGVEVDQYGRVLLADQAGQIFGTVCMIQFEDEDASTVCRQLGLGQHGAAIPVQRSSSYIHAIFNVFCTGVESSLQQCAHETVDYTGACHSAEDAGVHCFGGTNNSSSPSNTSHVQFGVDLDQYGRVLLADQAGQIFGTVCMLQFEDEDASTVCRQLGLGQHGTAIPVPRSSTYTHKLFNVLCTGVESSLQQCVYETVDYNGVCRGAEDAGVHCFGGTTNSTSQSNTSHTQFGVEVDQYGRVLLADQAGQIFGTVCMLQFEDEDASTVCRQLGLGQHGAAIPVPSSSSYIHAMFNVFCTGVESNLQQCAHETVDYSGACHGAEDAGVQCFGSTTNSSSPSNTSHTQFGVEVDQYGRVLLADQAGQIFGTVCMIQFEDEDASTVCRQLSLGQHGTAIPVPRSSTYTHKLFNVLCTGVESSLQQCVYETVDYNGVCRGAEDAGVHCFGGTTNSTSQSNTSHTQFGVKVDQYGRVLLADQAGQIFGTVCMLQFEDEDASTVCRQLGLGQHGAAIPVPRSSSYIHAMFNVFCTGVESNLQQCAHETVDYTGACHSAEDAGVHCFGSTTNSINPANTGHTQFGVEVDQYGRVLLADQAGQIFGTVCMLQFEDEDASTVCRQLGLGQHGAAIPVPRSSSYIHAMFNVFCTGVESNLQQCAHETVDYSGACHGAEDAGVHCFGSTTNSSSPSNTSHAQFGVEVDQYGRVLLADQAGQIFGTVCMLQFEDEDASTVCRQLGLGQHGTAIPVPRSSSYTHAMFNVFCTGVESNLQQCAHETVDYTGACNGAEDAGVQCFGSTTNSSSPANTGHVQFGVEVDQYGRVLLADQAGQIFGSVCMLQFEDEGASTVCRQLGLGQHGTAIPIPRNSSYTHKLFNVLCTGVESNLQQCVYETADQSGACHSAEDAGVHCFGSTTFSGSSSNTRTHSTAQYSAGTISSSVLVTPKSSHPVNSIPLSSIHGLHFQSLPTSFPSTSIPGAIFQSQQIMSSQLMMTQQTMGFSSVTPHVPFMFSVSDQSSNYPYSPSTKTLLNIPQSIYSSNNFNQQSMKTSQVAFSLHNSQYQQPPVSSILAPKVTSSTSALPPASSIIHLPPTSLSSQQYSGLTLVHQPSTSASTMISPPFLSSLSAPKSSVLSNPSFISSSLAMLPLFSSVSSWAYVASPTNLLSAPAVPQTPTGPVSSVYPNTVNNQGFGASSPAIPAVSVISSSIITQGSIPVMTQASVTPSSVVALSSNVWSQVLPSTGKHSTVLSPIGISSLQSASTYNGQITSKAFTGFPTSSMGISTTPSHHSSSATIISASSWSSAPYVPSSGHLSSQSQAGISLWPSVIVTGQYSSSMATAGVSSQSTVSPSSGLFSSPPTAGQYSSSLQRSGVSSRSQGVPSSRQFTLLPPAGVSLWPSVMPTSGHYSLSLAHSGVSSWLHASPSSGQFSSVPQAGVSLGHSVISTAGLYTSSLQQSGVSPWSQSKPSSGQLSSSTTAGVPLWPSVLSTAGQYSSFLQQSGVSPWSHSLPSSGQFSSIPQAGVSWGHSVGTTAGQYSSSLQQTGVSSWAPVLQSSGQLSSLSPTKSSLWPSVIPTTGQYSSSSPQSGVSSWSQYIPSSGQFSSLPPAVVSLWPSVIQTAGQYSSSLLPGVPPWSHGVLSSGQFSSLPPAGVSLWPSVIPTSGHYSSSLAHSGVSSWSHVSSSSGQFSSVPQARVSLGHSVISTAGLYPSSLQQSGVSPWSQSKPSSGQLSSSATAGVPLWPSVLSTFGQYSSSLQQSGVSPWSHSLPSSGQLSSIPQAGVSWGHSVGTTAGQYSSSLQQTGVSSWAPFVQSSGQLSSLSPTKSSLWPSVIPTTGQYSSSSPQSGVSSWSQYIPSSGQFSSLPTVVSLWPSVIQTAGQYFSSLQQSGVSLWSQGVPSSGQFSSIPPAGISSWPSVIPTSGHYSSSLAHSGVSSWSHASPSSGQFSSVPQAGVSLGHSVIPTAGLYISSLQQSGVYPLSQGVPSSGQFSSVPQAGVSWGPSVVTTAGQYYSSLQQTGVSSWAPVVQSSGHFSSLSPSKSSSLSPVIPTAGQYSSLLSQSGISPGSHGVPSSGQFSLLPPAGVSSWPSVIQTAGQYSSSLQVSGVSPWSQGVPSFGPSIPPAGISLGPSVIPISGHYSSSFAHSGVSSWSHTSPSSGQFSSLPPAGVSLGHSVIPTAGLYTSSLQQSGVSSYAPVLQPSGQLSSLSPTYSSSFQQSRLQPLSQSVPSTGQLSSSTTAGVSLWPSVLTTAGQYSSSLQQTGVSSWSQGVPSSGQFSSLPPAGFSLWPSVIQTSGQISSFLAHSGVSSWSYASPSSGQFSSVPQAGVSWGPSVVSTAGQFSSSLQQTVVSSWAPAVQSSGHFSSLSPSKSLSLSPVIPTTGQYSSLLSQSGMSPGSHGVPSSGQFSSLPPAGVSSWPSVIQTAGQYSSSLQLSGVSPWSQGVPSSGPSIPPAGISLGPSVIPISGHYSSSLAHSGVSSWSHTSPSSGQYSSLPPAGVSLGYSVIPTAGLYTSSLQQSGVSSYAPVLQPSGQLSSLSPTKSSLLTPVIQTAGQYSSSFQQSGLQPLSQSVPSTGQLSSSTTAGVSLWPSVLTTAGQYSSSLQQSGVSPWSQGVPSSTQFSSLPPAGFSLLPSVIQTAGQISSSLAHSGVSSWSYASPFSGQFSSVPQAGVSLGHSVIPTTGQYSSSSQQSVSSWVPVVQSSGQLSSLSLTKSSLWPSVIPTTGQYSSSSPQSGMSSWSQNTPSPGQFSSLPPAGVSLWPSVIPTAGQYSSSLAQTGLSSWSPVLPTSGLFTASLSPGVSSAILSTSRIYSSSSTGLHVLSTASISTAHYSQQLFSIPPSSSTNFISTSSTYFPLLSIATISTAHYSFSSTTSPSSGQHTTSATSSGVSSTSITSSTTGQTSTVTTAAAQTSSMTTTTAGQTSTVTTTTTTTTTTGSGNCAPGSGSCFIQQDSLGGGANSIMNRYVFWSFVMALLSIILIYGDRL